MPSRSEIEAYLRHLADSERQEEGVSVFPDGSPTTICTSSARLVARKFGGKVYGYYIDDDNPDLVGNDSGGHDFAIVGNYLVDWWAHYVENSDFPAVYDLTDRRDQKLTARRYIPREEWKPVPVLTESNADQEYLQAVSAGDMETAQRLVDAAARAAGYTMEVWRGDDGPHTDFQGRREVGVFTSTTKAFAASYALNGQPRRFYVKADKVLDLTDPWKNRETIDWITRWSADNEYDWNDPQSGEETDAHSVLAGGRLFDYEGDWSASRWIDLQRSARADGYSVLIALDTGAGLPSDEAVSTIVLKDSHIKSADPVVHDDWGKVIPVSRRFNDRTNDIREKVDRLVRSLLKEEEEDTIFITRRSPEERKKNWKIAVYRQVKQYMKGDRTGDLDLSGTPITSLPDGLTVGGYLNLGGTPITSLPYGLTVGGNLRLTDTPLAKLSDEEIRRGRTIKGEICC